MASSFTILIFSRSDAVRRLEPDLLQNHGTRPGLHFVQTVAEFEAGLHNPEPDVVLAELLPGDNLFAEVLAVAREHAPLTPLITLTSSENEEAALATIDEGAFDYVLLEHSRRLKLAIHRALEKKHLDAELRQAQKLEIIGRLAAGMAHDFNNILTVISGYSSLALEELAADSPIRKSLEQIRKAGSVASTLTRQLLSFSRRQVITPKIINLNTLLSEMEKMLLRLLRDDINLKLMIATGIGSIKADPGQVEQVVMNLVLNAQDAMPAGGEIIISTYASSRKDNSFLERPGSAELYTCLAVQDTGIGMDEETCSRIFDPFYSTKPEGRGTGLGLSAVYGIVRQNNGLIQVDSAPGQGTTFRVYFPIVEQEEQVEKEEITLADVAQRRATILLVEDDESVRDLIHRVLTREGYTILEAHRAGDALILCEQHSGTIDLLLTDIILPQINGRDLAERLRNLRPNMKVLYMSGYTDKTIFNPAFLEQGYDFIKKPFSPKNLLKRVQALLDSPVPSP